MCGIQDIFKSTEIFFTRILSSGDIDKWIDIDGRVLVSFLTSPPHMLLFYCGLHFRGYYVFHTLIHPWAFVRFLAVSDIKKANQISILHS